MSTPRNLDVNFSTLQNAINQLDAAIARTSPKSYSLSAPMAGSACAITASGWEFTVSSIPVHLPNNKAAKVVHIDLPALPVGARLSSVSVFGTLYSDAAHASVLIELYKTYLTNDYVDTVLVTDGSLSADIEAAEVPFALNATTAKLDDFDLTVAAGESYFLKITGTTDASGEIFLANMLLEVEEA